jgi:SAM-dependent methyltransferase
MAPARIRDVAFADLPAGDLHAGLTEDLKRFALEGAPHAMVLDLGCGEGRVAFWLAPHAKKLVGLDKDARAVEHAKQRARSLGLANAEFHAADVEKAPVARFAPGGADLAVSHLFLSKAVVEHAKDALRPGGSFVFTAFGPAQWQEAGGSPFAHGEAEVRSWLTGAGLKVEAISVEDTRIRFSEIAQVRSFLGEETVQKWLRDGRWDKLVASFGKAKVLTESRLTARARR